MTNISEYDILPQEIYCASLVHIKDVKFTCREMEIIACLLNGRQEKTIASLLGIDDRAVSSHTNNIRRKLGCNSREGIINFIESSEQASLIKNTYYQSLKNRSAFENRIKRLYPKVNNHLSPCLIVEWQESEDQPQHTNTLKKYIKEQLIKHLSLIGIEATIESKKGSRFLEKLNKHNGPIILFVSKEQLGHLLKKDGFGIVLNSSVSEVPFEITVIVVDKEKTLTTPQALNYEGQGAIYSVSDYYPAFISCVKKLCPEIDFKKVIDFSETHSSQIISEDNQPVIHSQNIQSVLLNIFHKHKNWVFRGSLICIIVMSVLLLTTNKSTNIKIPFQSSHEEAAKKPGLKERWLSAAQKFCGRASSSKRVKNNPSHPQKAA